MDALVAGRARRAMLVAAALLAALGAAGGGCARGGGGAVTLTGAGATFPYPLYSRWIAEYGRTHPGVVINYQSLGSGAGVRQLLEGTVDFGATDVPMSDAELARAAGPVLHVPTALGAVAVTYNLPDLPRPLSLTAELLGDLYLGRITRWDDPRLRAANPGLPLPARPVTVVHRSDGSGTTEVFTGYLSRNHPGWREQVGAGKAVRWPVGVGAKGNEGVTGQIRLTPGAVGYVELTYALQNRLPAARLRNRAGEWVAPDAAGMAAAAAAATAAPPPDLRLSLVDAPAPGAYPMTSLTYIVVYRDQRDRRRGEELARFLWWAVHDGQRFNAELHYGPLPQTLMARVEEQLRLLNHRGRKLLPAAAARAGR